MYVLSIPTVFESSSVGDVLDLMKQSNRRAVAVRLGNGYGVVFEEDIARKARDLPVGNKLPPTATCISAHLVAKFDLDMVDPWRSPDEYARMFKALNIDLAIFGFSPDNTLLVTASESLARTISTGGYHCTGRPRHYFPGPTVSVGDKCPWGQGTIVPD